MGRNKSSAIFLVIISFAWFYVAYSVTEVFIVLDDKWEQFDNDRIELIPAYINLGNGFLEQNKVKQAALYVEKAIDENLVDFYYITEKDSLKYFYSKKVKDPSYIKIHTKSIGNLLISDKFSYASTKVGDNVLTIGVIHTKFDHFIHFFLEDKGTHIRNIIIVLLGALLITVYYFRDILAVLNFLGTGAKKDISKIKPKSKEGEALILGLGAYNDRAQSLKEENLRLGGQVLSALRTELDSGKEPPYEFDCTMVRTDINNFSHIFSNHPVKEFMEIINNFFTEVTRIVSHYDGVVSEFLGDEVIYYFKDDIHKNSKTIAVSAVRDINNLAVHFNEMTVKNNGYGFVVKSSMSYGRLMFGKQVNAFSLSGSVLIETVRILSHIKEKEENTIYYTDKFANDINFLCESEKGEIVELKGLPGPIQLCSYKKHKSLKLILEQVTKENVQELTYYRNLSSIVEILNTLSSPARLDPQIYNQILSTLRYSKISSDDNSLIQQYKNVLGSLCARWLNEGAEQDIFFLSTAVNLSMSLFTPEAFEKEITPALEMYIEQDVNHRLTANIVDVYQHFNVSFEKLLEKKLVQHIDNRVMANALVKIGKERLTKGILKHLSKMLKDDRNVYISSALFAIGELAFHYKKEDLVFFKTSSSLQGLIKKLKKYIDDEDEMIRRQALIAAKKIQDTQLNDFIEKLSVENGSFEKDVLKYYAA